MSPGLVWNHDLLLDTHIFLWFSGQPERLNAKIRAALQDPQNVLFLSVVSVWELQIKTQTGKLSLPLPLNQFVPLQRSFNQIRSLPVIEPHLWRLASLPMHHRDPFDRLLVAQSLAEEFLLVTTDPILARYPVSLLQ